MEEHDVRRRFESFLKRTARDVITPVAVGLGLWLSGCSGCSDGLPLFSHPTAEVVPTDGDVQAVIPPDGGKIDGPPLCPQTDCPALRCTLYTSNPAEPCSCPICLPTPDAGPDIGPVCPPAICPNKVRCSRGYQQNPDDPCGCPVCAPAPDAGVDARAPDTDVDEGTMPHCGDGILDTSLGEECDMGSLNGMRIDTNGNPTVSCPYCSTNCTIPLCLF
jgi:hypothetical protein